MPGPRSVTPKTTAPSRRSTSTRTTSPAGEKLIALDRRLNRICRTRRSSAKKLPISGAARTSSRTAFSAMRSCSPSTAASTADRISTSFKSSGMAPASMVVRSRMSLMIASSALEDLVDRGEIVALLLGDRPDRRPDHRIEQQMRESDDVGERRAQFVGDVLHELVLEPVGVLQARRRARSTRARRSPSR